MLINNNEYFAALEDIKARIKIAQYKAASNANKELMELYWNIGKTIISNTKYGAKFLENLSRDIRLEFPDIQGFSVRNLMYMRKFAELYPDFQKVQRGVALLPWRNNLTLMSKVKNDAERQWYIAQNLENGWNNTILTHQIEMKLYERQAIAEKTTNYDKLLPSPFSELATDMLKSPYIFDFIERREGIIERGRYQKAV
ncbi:MAG: DUF1016 N-terminal domain-containing protein [Chitinispirillales bacterium]|jgi:predicted nuclease of restriction endonuclease-like (RecB) superfamily|nr:DUF1016 N-terminal domain-containing protein [Chitinispirillales bacterium]